jgi:opacity protein-like surface antigen
MLRALLFILALALCATSTLAQDPNNHPRFELYGGYLDSGEPQYNIFHYSGGIQLQSDFGTHHGLEASVIRNFNRYFGLKGDFSAHFHQDDPFTVTAVCPGTTPPCPSATQPATQNAKLFNFLAGPEFKWRKFSRVTPFGHALFGLAHTTGTFSTSGAVVTLSRSTTETGFAMAFGGGLDVRILPRFSLRTSVDYNPKFVGHDEDGSRIRLDDLRFSVGILFHLYRVTMSLDQK